MLYESGVYGLGLRIGGSMLGCSTFGGVGLVVAAPKSSLRKRPVNDETRRRMNAMKRMTIAKKSQ